MNRTKMTKMLSTTLSLALTISSVPFNVSAAGPVGASAPAFAEQLAPKASLGYVASSYAPSGEEKPRLIVIADLHAHVDVQRNIMGIMDELMPKLRGKSNKKVPVFLEGGWDKNLEEPLRDLKSPQTRRFINEYFLQKAELGGPQAFSEKVAGSNKVSMIGVEDKDEYLANKAIFAKSYPARKQVLEAIKMQEASLGLLEKHVQARSYEKLKNMREAYLSGRISAERFAKTLLRHAGRYHMEGKNVSALKNITTANPVDVEVALSNVYKEVSERLSDKRPLLSYVRPSLEKEPVVRKNLAIVNSDLDLLKRLISNQLTPSEVTLAYSRIAELERTAKLLAENQPITVDVSQVIRQSLEFYPLAIMRDETLVKNSLASLQPFGTDATGILVVGGFHTDAIASFLQSRGVAHVVIHPVVSRDLTTDEHLNYIKRMGDDHVTAKELTQDLAKIQSGKKIARGASTGATFTGTHQGTVIPGDGVTDTDKKKGGNFMGGLSPDVLAALEQGGDALAKALEKLGLSADSEAVEGLTLALRDGRYVVVGQEASPSVFADIANAALAGLPAGASRPETLSINPLGDVEALKSLGSESKLEISDDGKSAVMPIAVSRFQSLRAIDEGVKPAEGTPEEANYLRAVHTVAHEASELAGTEEKTTIVRGAALAATYVANNQGASAVGRLSEAMQPQFEAGKDSQDLAKVGPASITARIQTALTPNDLKVEKVQKIAKSLAQAFPELTAKQIEDELAKMEGSMAMNAALYLGNNKGLIAKLKGVVQDMREAALYAAQA